MKSKSLTTSNLTASDLQTAGVETKINQNDLVEIIASGIHENVLNELSRITEKKKELVCFYSKYQTDFVKLKTEEFIKTLISKKLLKKTDVIQTSQVFSGGKTITYLYDGNSGKKVGVNILTENTSGNNLYTYLHSINPSWYSDASSATISVIKKIEEKVSGVNMVTQQVFSKKVSIPTPTKLIEDVRKDMDQLHKDSMILWESIPSKIVAHGKLISLEQFTKISKISINKEILKNQAPDMINQIEKLFNIKLK